MLRGTTNAVIHLQSSPSNEIPAILRFSILIWLNDFMIDVSIVDYLFNSKLAFVEVYLRCNLKSHRQKCVLFLSEIRSCGRDISHEGVCFDTRCIGEIQEMDTPVAVFHLHKFLYLMKWIRSAISPFSDLIRPLFSFR